ncbi:hypothetical protein TgHK011_005669 [Trichoderma gracile]|nr:hypothetical protein TgHK011_005669 [Trichoderma gracile]
MQEVWHASGGLGRKIDLQIITRQSANLLQQFVPVCLGGPLVRARTMQLKQEKYSLHSIAPPLGREHTPSLSRYDTDDDDDHSPW